MDGLPFWVAIPVVALLIPIAGIVADAVKKVKQREHLHQERLKAIEMGMGDSLPNLLMTDSKSGDPLKRNGRTNGRNTAVHGAIWTGIGGGLLLATITSHVLFRNEDLITFVDFLMIWSFPALGVGVALLVFARRKPEARGSSHPRPPADS